jgi:tRNA-specific 2-thiouridylase
MLTAERINWLIAEPTGPFRAAVQIRHRHAPASATVEPTGAGRVEVRFDEPQSAITPGQAVVLFNGSRVLGGGWIA